MEKGALEAQIFFRTRLKMEALSEDNRRFEKAVLARIFYGKSITTCGKQVTTTLGLLFALDSITHTALQQNRSPTLYLPTLRGVSLRFTMKDAD